MENVGEGDKQGEFGDGAHGCRDESSDIHRGGVGGGIGGDCGGLTQTVSSSITKSILVVFACARPRPRRPVCLRDCLRV